MGNNMTRSQAQDKVDENYRAISGIVNILKMQEKALDDKRAMILRKLERILSIVGSGSEYKEGIRRLDADGYRAYAALLSNLVYKMQNGGIRDMNLPNISLQRDFIFPRPEPIFTAGRPVHKEPEPVKDLSVDPDKYNVRAIFSITNNDKLIFYIQDMQTGKEDVLFEIPATNNQIKREYPTRKGNDPVPSDDETNEILKTTPNSGELSYPYIPRKFPQGKCEIYKFEKMEPDNIKFGPYKIRTNAKRFVHPWEYVPKDGEYVWNEKTDTLVEDNGLLIHGGGKTTNSDYNPLTNNNYKDTTEGCIRIRNDDVLRIVNALQKYLDKKKIELTVTG